MDVILIILPFFLLSIFLIVNLLIKNVDVKLISKTFFQFSSDNLIDKLSKVIPALFTKISIPSNFSSTRLIKFSILSCSSNLNFSEFILLNLFLRFFYHNQAEVAPGVFRSNQPSPDRLNTWAKSGIKTVINLRGETTIL